MGGGAGKEEQLEFKKNSENKIFLDEGVGIESSHLSRKWTTKMSLFGTLNQSNPQPQTKLKQTFQQRQQSISEESNIYEDEYNSETSEKSDKGSIIYKQDSPNKKQPGLKQIQASLKQQQANEIKDDSDIEEEILPYKSLDLHKDQFIPPRQLLSDNDSKDDDLDENARKFRHQFEQFPEITEIDTLNSQDDLAFAEQIDIEKIMSSDIQANFQNQFKRKDQEFHLKRLYVRSRLGREKPSVGQDKKIKFDAKQDDEFEIYEQEDDSISDSIGQRPNLVKQREYHPQEFLSDIGVAVACKKGNKREGPHMNDYFVYNDNNTKIIALVNAHGDFGHIVSNIAYRFLFKNLVRLPIFYTNPKRALQRVLFQLQADVRAYLDNHKQSDQNCILSGCVITVVLQREGKLIIGHIGDNRTTVYKELQQGAKQKNLFAELTPVHCPLDYNEKARIFTQGGEVRKIQMDEFVYVRGRLYPQLHVTRSIGDLIGHVIGVTSLPYMREYDITVNDTFLLMSTASAFTYMEQDEIMNHLTGFTMRTIRQACDSLYKRAKSSWLVSEGMFEDMTIILIWLGSTKEQK